MTEQIKEVAAESDGPSLTLEGRESPTCCGNQATVHIQIHTQTHDIKQLNQV